MFNKIKIKTKIKHKGLTIVELLVVVSIFMIITSISIFNYSKFNSYTSTQNLADDIALTVRQAQSYAIGVSGVSGNFLDIGYGVHFGLDQDPLYSHSGSTTSFILFADIDGDKVYDYDTNNLICGDPYLGNECLEILTIKSDDFISSFIIDDAEEVIDPSNTLDIVFKRPNPEPVFCHRVNNLSCDTNIYSLGIKVSNQEDPSKIFKIIEVSNVGQISVF